MSALEEPHGVPGAQVVRRVALLLRLLGERVTEGRPISELTERTGLKRPTVHRLLVALAEEGLIEQDAKTRKWRLGDEAYILGTIAGVRYQVEAVARATIIRIAELTGESAFFSVRRGMDVVALLREEGTYPIRTHVIQVGDRWPMAVGTASIAMLAAMPDDDVRSILDYNESAFARFPKYPVAKVWDLIQETRERGYSINRGLVLRGSWGLAAAVRDGAGQPTMAVSITAIENRISGAREPELARILMDQAASLTERIRSDRLAKGN